MATEGEKVPQDIEAGPCLASDTDEKNVCVCVTVYLEEHCQSLRESSDVKILGDQDLCDSSSDSDCSVEMDLECGILDIKANAKKSEKICRICHIGFQKKSGLPFEMGCLCKGDLASAHKHCAETWFKLKGNNKCEICGSTAMNMVGTGDAEVSEALKESSSDAAAATAVERYCQGHRLIGFLLACMLFVIIISWPTHLIKVR